MPVTEVIADTGLHEPRAGGGLRRALLTAGSVVTWVVALSLLGAGIAPGGEVPTEPSIRLALAALGVVLAAAPIALLHLPARRRVRRQVTAVLLAAQSHPVPALPAPEGWSSPLPMFKRLWVSSLTYVSIPLLLLLGWSGACALFLREGEAAVAFGIAALVPAGFLVITLGLTRRLVSGVQSGLAAGQVVPLTVHRRIDLKTAVSDAVQSWFEAALPDGQRVLLRTPRHYSWAGDARGVLEDPDLVLIIGEGGHQGVVLAPSRPEDAVWLLGPVPAGRAPRSVLRAFAADR